MRVRVHVYQLYRPKQNDPLTGRMLIPNVNPQDDLQEIVPMRSSPFDMSYLPVIPDAEDIDVPEDEVGVSHTRAVPL